MKNKSIISLIIFLNLFSEQQHPEVAALEILERECDTCERIYSSRNQMTYLNNYRINSLKTVQNWLNTQPKSKVTEDIQEYLKQIKNESDSIIIDLASNPKVADHLAKIEALINKIDPLLPEKINLENQNFYETMKEIWDIDNDLRTLAIPDVYRRWLTKRLTLNANQMTVL